MPDIRVCASFSQYSTAQVDTLFLSIMNLNYVILTLYNHSKETLFFQVKNKPNAD
jgi:hypothetical protein